MATVMRLITLTRTVGHSNPTFAINYTKTQVQNVLIPTRNVATKSRASALRRAIRKSRIISEESAATTCKSKHWSSLQIRNVILW